MFSERILIGGQQLAIATSKLSRYQFTTGQLTPKKQTVENPTSASPSLGSLLPGWAEPESLLRQPAHLCESFTVTVY